MSSTAVIAEPLPAYVWSLFWGEEVAAMPTSEMREELRQAVLTEIELHRQLTRRVEEEMRTSRGGTWSPAWVQIVITVGGIMVALSLAWGNVDKRIDQNARQIQDLIKVVDRMATVVVR